MIKEKSCGAVVYKWENSKLDILILKMQKGHFSIPKGHVEEDETEEQTALREIKEETNLDVCVDTRFREVVTYSPYEGCTKDVVFFVAELKGGELVNQEVEVAELYWLEPSEALNILTFDSDKLIVEKAIKYIKKQ